MRGRSRRPRIGSGVSTARITLAIPFYGRTDFLDTAITSIQRQSVGDWVALVVDDCSPSDQAQALVARLDDPRIGYIRNERNLGLAGNWNRCIEASGTPLVALLHGDDELMPDYVEKMLAAHERWQDAAAVFCGAQVIDDQGVRMFSFRDHVKQWLLPNRTQPFELAGESGMISLLRGNFIICPTLCYKRSLFEKLRFSADWRMVLDVDLYVRALIADRSFVGLPDVAYRYRRHATQVTAECERNLQLFSEETALWSWAAREAHSLGWHRAAKVARKMTIIKLQLGYYILTNALRLQLGDAWKKTVQLGATWAASRRL